MDRAIIDEILDELSSTLQRVEAQSSAILEVAKEKDIVKEDELAPYLERANAASSVRWRATRVRLEKLFSGLEKKQEQEEQQKEEPGKESAQNKEQPKKEVQKSEAEQAGGGKPTEEAQKGETGKAALPRAAGETRRAQAEKTVESKPMAKREIERPPAEPLQRPGADERREPKQPKQPAPAVSGRATRGRGEQESRPREQAQREKTTPATAQQSSDKSKRPEAA